MKYQGYTLVLKTKTYNIHKRHTFLLKKRDTGKDVLYPKVLFINFYGFNDSGSLTYKLS